MKTNNQSNHMRGFLDKNVVFSKSPDEMVAVLNRGNWHWDDYYNVCAHIEKLPNIDPGIYKCSVRHMHPDDDDCLQYGAYQIRNMHCMITYEKDGSPRCVCE